MVAEGSSDEEADEDELHAKIPPLPGHKDHRCTDKLSLVVLVFVAMCQVRMYQYGHRNGDLHALTRGYDHSRRLCTDENGGSNMMYCMTRSDRVLAYWPICVADCPQGHTNHTHSCFRNDTGQMEEFLDYSSVEVFRYCMPTDPQKLAQTLMVMSGSMSLRDSPEHPHASMTVFLAKLGRVYRAWLPLLVLANVAVVLGYVYLLMLDRCAKLLVYICEAVFVVGALLAAVYFFWSGFHHIGCGKHCDQEEYNEAIRHGTDPVMNFIFSVLLFGVAFLSVCMFAVANSQIETAVGCIEATCECIFEEPSILLEPFLSLSLKVGVLLFCGSSFVYLISSGTIELQTNGFDRSFSYNFEQLCYLVGQCLLALWAMEAVHACSQYAIAWTTQMWYFTPYVNGHKLDQQRCAVCRAYVNAVGYHLGTLAKGSALSLASLPLRYTLGIVHAALRHVGCKLSSGYSLWYRTNIAKFQKTAYMDVAITSSNYAVAADRALAILEEEVKSLAVLNGAQVVFQVALIALLALFGFFGTFLLAGSVTLFSDVGSPHYIQDPGVVAVAASVMCGIIGTSFTLVFDTVGDTILYCFATEQRRHARLDHGTYGASSPPPESGYFSWLLGYGTVQDPHEGDDPVVDYAPQRLRDLIHASTQAAAEADDASIE